MSIELEEQPPQSEPELILEFQTQRRTIGIAQSELSKMLRYAAKNGYINFTILALQYDFDIDEKSPGNLSALDHAVRNEHFLIARLLILAGANIDTTTVNNSKELAAIVTAAEILQHALSELKEDQFTGVNHQLIDAFTSDAEYFSLFITNLLADPNLNKSTRSGLINSFLKTNDCLRLLLAHICFDAEDYVTATLLARKCQQTDSWQHLCFSKYCQNNGVEPNKISARHKLKFDFLVELARYNIEHPGDVRDFQHTETHLIRPFLVKNKTADQFVRQFCYSEIARYLSSTYNAIGRIPAEDTRLIRPYTNLGGNEIFSGSSSNWNSFYEEANGEADSKTTSPSFGGWYSMWRTPQEVSTDPKQPTPATTPAG